MRYKKYVRGVMMKLNYKTISPNRKCRADGKIIMDRGYAEKCAKQHNKEGDVRMNAYRGTCGCWHIGHNNKKTK